GAAVGEGLEVDELGRRDGIVEAARPRPLHRDVVQAHRVLISLSCELSRSGAGAPPPGAESTLSAAVWRAPRRRRTGGCATLHRRVGRPGRVGGVANGPFLAPTGATGTRVTHSVV